jgi:molybdopterin/thiamine biosynthesis adenylyltransferase
MRVASCPKSTRYSTMHDSFSTAMSGDVHAKLLSHLLRSDGQEDLCFALWTPSHGSRRLTALLHTVLLPEAGEREVHGNASFHASYFERAAATAASQGCGLAFLHSHLGPGWQGMSHDDVVAERDRLAGATLGMTDLPILGLTLGTDGSWSARVWRRSGPKQYARTWCESVRVVGEGQHMTFCDELLPRPAFRDTFRRTVTVWGAQKHTDMARLRIGIVGLGSVGAIVAESLVRMGMTRFVLIDHDRVEAHNLDRLLFADEHSVGRFKVALAAERMRTVATAESIEIEECTYSIAEETGYRAALDCDVLFSCVDRPRPRHILNHFAYAHLIPVIDGGIDVRFKSARFSGADWQVQTVGPGKPCLACLGAYKVDDVSVEEAGMLDNPSYMRGLGEDHRFKRNENVFPFSANLASLEVLQFIALTTHVAGIADFGIQRFRYVPGILEAWGAGCDRQCESAGLVAQGDRHFHLFGPDLAAERSREPST